MTHTIGPNHSIMTELFSWDPQHAPKSAMLPPFNPLNQRFTIQTDLTYHGDIPMKQGFVNPPIQHHSYILKCLSYIFIHVFALVISSISKIGHWPSPWKKSLTFNPSPPESRRGSMPGRSCCCRGDDTIRRGSPAGSSKWIANPWRRRWVRRQIRPGKIQKIVGPWISMRNHIRWHVRPYWSRYDVYC